MAKYIELYLGEHEIGWVYKGRFESSLDSGPFMPDLRQRYEDCLFGIQNRATFEERFRRVMGGQYFCF